MTEETNDEPRPLGPEEPRIEHRDVAELGYCQLTREELASLIDLLLGGGVHPTAMAGWANGSDTGIEPAERYGDRIRNLEEVGALSFLRLNTFYADDSSANLTVVRGAGQELGFHSAKEKSVARERFYGAKNLAQGFTGPSLKSPFYKTTGFWGAILWTGMLATGYVVATQQKLVWPGVVLILGGLLVLVGSAVLERRRPAPDPVVIAHRRGLDRSAQITLFLGLLAIIVPSAVAIIIALIQRG